MDKFMWHPAMNRWHDQTGIAHVMGDNGAAICGANPFSLGGGFERAEDGGAHECRRCAAVVTQKSSLKKGR